MDSPSPLPPIDNGLPYHANGQSRVLIYAVICLGGTIGLSVLGMTAVALQGREIPPALNTIASTAIGSLASLLAMRGIRSADMK